MFASKCQSATSTNALLNKVQTHHHTTTCRKKKGVRCRFNAPWPPSTRTLLARAPGRISANKLKAAKKIIDNVLSTIVQINDISNVSEKALLKIAGVSEDIYYNALMYVLVHLYTCTLVHL